jgi:hypothetical protein
VTRALAAILFLAACTGTPGPPGAEPPRSGGSGRAPISVPLVLAGEDRTGIADGARLAIREENRAGGVRGRPIRLERFADLGAALEAGPPVVLAVGAGEQVSELRAEIEAHAVPVLLLGDDLYTGRGLFRYVFQSAIPVRWQADVLARYLVEDRDHPHVGVVGDGEAERNALGEAVEEEGGRLVPPETAASVVVLPGGQGPIPSSAQIALATDLAFPSDEPPPPGTVAVAPYTWSGWAEPIPHVARFRHRFREELGRFPGGLEQEGYDAVRLLADALRRTGGRGGDSLVRVLESFEDATYSSIPIHLGPDDHVLAEESQLGLFAVAGPGEEAEPWLRGRSPWRPIMRTFTYDGERVIILERDLPVFFPSWEPPAPSPSYDESRFGITTAPEADPLH